MPAVDQLERGRGWYASRDWTEARESLALADQATPLGPDDLELLATSAYMLGRDDDDVRAVERAHHGYLGAGEAMRAVRCAFWLGVELALRGEMGRASGWFGRAHRLVGREARPCVEQGYLLLPAVLQHRAAGDYEAAAADATRAAEIGERFADADLVALAMHERAALCSGTGGSRRVLR